MKAVILAAGRGSRMKERTKVRPKCLTELWGRTLLEWQLKAFERAGINAKDIAVITGYHAEEIRAADPAGVQFFHNPDWEKTNMVSTLLFAEDWLTAEECIVSYADIVYSFHAIQLLAEYRGDLALTYYTEFLPLWQARFENPLEDLESFRVSKEGKLLEIGRRVSDLKEIEGQYMGLLKFTPKGWREVRQGLAEGLPKPVERMDMTGLFAHLLSRGVEIAALPYEDLWLEVDRPEDAELYSSWKEERYRALL